MSSIFFNLRFRKISFKEGLETTLLLSEIYIFRMLATDKFIYFCLNF